ncbi:E1-E2 ATPase-domain-containing protein [Chytriomyces sp. MP71]|nr:E1-E2 ATPase-domain-containing protein [Chytriomyces sp. MP71]
MLLVSGIAAYVVLAIDYNGNFQNTYLGAILLLVAFMNAGIEFYQHQKSAAILESFLNLIPSQCYVIRDGQTQQINAKELVLGDLVVIRSGDKIPADVVIIGSTELKVDNSSLTGEADPQERSKRNTQHNPLEATNLAFNGTLAVVGNGYGVVVRTGDNTVIGQIASLTANEERRESPMTVEIDNFVKLVAGIAGVIAIAFFIVAMTVKANKFSIAMNFAIGTFVSFVPEGLPATVTMLLTIAAARMAKRQVLCKDLQGVETLGAITLLATDKTGTLTRNQMTVTYVWTGLRLYIAQALSEGTDDAKICVPFEYKDSDATDELIHIATLNPTAKFTSNEGPIATREVLGDATEAGLVRFAASKLPTYDETQNNFPKVFEIPFNSSNKWAMTIHQKKHANGSLVLYIKGAPERVLKLCSSIHDGQNAVPLVAEHKAKFEEMYTMFASKGHRVLAFAYLPLPGNEFPEDFEFSKDPVNYPTDNLTFLGLTSLEDPPKHGVREAVGKARAAGIRVMMVTGDHPLTAEAIGRKINLMLTDTKAELAKKRGVPESQVPESEVNAIVVHGDTIDGLSEAQWENIFEKEEIIFARTSPKHKLDIVKHAQARGHIVGVTGDGVNDSPALKKADLGIAMNISGSDVSKEAAAMILIDDNFASTISGIEEGRLIFQNLKKSIQYTITHTMPEVFANLFYIIVPLPLPLSSILILVVDLGFELFIALSYAYDVSENPEGLMQLMPRKPVTPQSVERLYRRRAADRAEGIIAADDLAKLTRALRKSCTRRFWAEKFEKTEDETLIDGDVLSYSYLEAGSIMTVGCLVCFFYALWYHYGITPAEAVLYGGSWGNADYTSNGRTVTADDQTKALALGQSAYYVGIMFQQCFNHFICKARLSSPYGSFMFKNLYSFLGIFLGGGLSLAIVYIPFLNAPFGTDHRLTPYVWLIACGFGVVLYIYSIIRSIVKRKLAPVKFSANVDGLQMFPTRFSTGGK